MQERYNLVRVAVALKGDFLEFSHPSWVGPYCLHIENAVLQRAGEFETIKHMIEKDWFQEQQLEECINIINATCVCVNTNLLRQQAEVWFNTRRVKWYPKT